MVSDSQPWLVLPQKGASPAQKSTVRYERKRQKHNYPARFPLHHEKAGPTLQASSQLEKPLCSSIEVYV